MRNADTSHMERILLYLFDDTHNLLPCSYDTLDISYITLNPTPWSPKPYFGAFAPPWAYLAKNTTMLARLGHARVPYKAKLSLAKLS